MGFRGNFQILVVLKREGMEEEGKNIPHTFQYLDKELKPFPYK